jgi:putative transposase
VRHGTTTLFAALDLASGRVLTQCKHRYRHQEFPEFLRHIDASLPQELAARPRFHVHYAPTYASWLNQIEIWFNIITQRAIRPGTFSSVRDLVAKIDYFVTHYNRRCQSFNWTATVDSILVKIERLCKAVAGTAH